MSSAENTRYSPAARRGGTRVLNAFAVAALVFTAVPGTPTAFAAATVTAPLSISPTPLFVAGSAKPNVLLTVANSNSMDEDATGLAVGSAAPDSKSEIARRVARGLVATYQSSVNMGLMAFQQTTSGGDPVVLYQLHNSPYDVSFDPADYDPTWTGARDSNFKRFRAPNVSSPGLFLYYNVNLPFYSNVNQGSAFCYSPTAHAFNNGEVLWAGPWDTYNCFSSKTNTSNALPVDGATEAAAGYSGGVGSFAFWPTDSDLGQGITDFGRFNAWNWVSPTWFSNGSPGGGYIHVPIGALDAARINAMNTKLGVSQFVTNGPNDPTLPLQNAGLTPLEGSLFTARSYFAGTLNDNAQGGPLAAPPNSCGKNFVILMTNGLPSVKRDGTPSSDVVTMLADATAAAAGLTADGVVTYVVGFALPFGVNPAQLDTIAAAGGTATAYNATNETELRAALDAVFADIISRSGAAAAVALSTGSVSSSTKIFQAKFDAGWVGQLNAYALNPTTGAVSTVKDWDAGLVLGTMNFDTDRRVITYKPSTGRGVPFRWPVDATAPGFNELDPAQLLALNTNISSAVDNRGATRLNYLRGDRSLEGSDLATRFRVRSGVLGDIVNSAPAFVGVPERNIRDTDYFAYRNSPALQGREPMVYVGANDGMLHGFRTSDGRERLAFVPSALYSALPRLTSQAYTHQYYVDGTPVVEDAKIGVAAPFWRTVLASGLGAGGRELFALDVTDPGNFNEAAAANISLWEFTSASDADLGYTYGIPAIGKMNDGSWAVMAGNGLNNTGSGQSGIFIINAATGAVIRKLLTGLGTPGAPNGIVGITPVDLDGNGTIDYIYAGDIYGRMWKFDLTANNAAAWTVAYGAPLYRARIGGTDQPITVAPEVTRHPLGGVMVEFGTGMYLQISDLGSTAQQTIYGIWDNGAAVADISNLVAQTVTGTLAVGGRTYRTVSSNAVNWSVKKGWYLNLPTSGERVVVDLLIRNSRLLVTSLIPNTDLCSAGGSSWLMEIDYQTGGQLATASLDTNGDGTVTASDTVVAGVYRNSIGSSPSVLDGFDSPDGPGTLEHLFSNLSDGEIDNMLNRSNPLANRRMSWRQIR
jgi:type IV pilus assembly protein PilY1